MIGPVNPIIAIETDPAVANRIIRTCANLDARVIRVDPGRVDFLILDGIVTGRRRRRRLADPDVIHLDLRIAFIER